MGEQDRKKLYQDAIYWHLIGQGYTELQAEVESKRRMAKRDAL